MHEPTFKTEPVIVDRIYAAIEKEQRRTDQYLGRLGSSFIGDLCARKVWLSWRGFYVSEFSGRMLRLFQTGHQQEERIVQDLRAAGLAVWNTDNEGNQFQFNDPTGHFITKVDGVVKGVPGDEDKPILLEIKTHNDKSFNDLVKNGLRASKPLHWHQMQSSMLYGGFKRGLYVALNKNNEHYHIETIESCEDTQTEVNERIIKLVNSTIPPVQISTRQESFTCRFCDASDVCWGKAPAKRNCRTCVRCSPGEGGTWVCGLLGETRNFDEQRAGCEHYEGFL
jgi:hypothetical protein